MPNFSIGDKVRINLNGASWNKKTTTHNITTEMIDGAEGVITQVLSFTGEAEHKVKTEFGEFKFWARDLESAEVEPDKARDPQKQAELLHANQRNLSGIPAQESDESPEDAA